MCGKLNYRPKTLRFSPFNPFMGESLSLGPSTPRDRCKPLCVRSAGRKREKGSHDSRKELTGRKAGWPAAVLLERGATASMSSSHSSKYRKRRGREIGDDFSELFSTCQILQARCRELHTHFTHAHNANQMRPKEIPKNTILLQFFPCGRSS